MALLSSCFAPLLSPPCSGQVTEPNQGYETLYVSLDDVQVGQSDGSVIDCLNTVSTLRDPDAVPALLQPGASVTIKLATDSDDGDYDGG